MPVTGWQDTKLGSLLTLVRNGYSGQQVGRVTNFPVSRIETISDGAVDTNKVGFVESIPDSYLLESDDILFSNINSLKHIGKVAQVEAGTKLFHGMNLLVLRLVDEVDEKFLFYVLVSAKPWFEKMAAQAINQASINQTTIRELPLHVPEKKPEQTKIAEVLSTVDRAIEQTGALIAKQQRIKTGLMQDLLTRGIDEHGNLRSEETHEFKDSPLGRIPVDWNVLLLGNIAEIKSGVTLGRDLSGPGTVELPYLRVANVQDGYVDLSEIKTVRVPKTEVPRYELQTSDVLMNEGGDFDKLGRGTVWQGQIAPCLHQNHVFRVRTDRRYLVPEFLAAVSGSTYGKRFFVLSSKQSTNLASINSTQLKGFPVPCPDVVEQHRIAEILDVHEARISTEEAYRDKLKLQKTALMQVLLTGEKRVTPLLEAG